MPRDAKLNFQTSEIRLDVIKPLLGVRVSPLTPARRAGVMAMWGLTTINPLSAAVPMIDSRTDALGVTFSKICHQYADPQSKLLFLKAQKP